MSGTAKKGISQVEAAKKYGVSQRLISRRIRQGLIRIIRPGGARPGL